MNDKLDPKPYQWDFDGACAPTRAGAGIFHHKTFSLGIFQWLPKKGGRGLKRGKVAERVQGITADPEAAYNKAREIVRELNRREGL